MDIGINAMSFIGLPALVGLVCLFVAAAVFKRPFIAIAAGILGSLIGLGLH